MNDLVFQRLAPNRLPMLVPRPRYPFAQMSLGEGLLLDDPKRAESARVAARRFVQRHQPNWRFSLRKSKEGWMLIRVQ